jgi:hypothetical protein
MKKVFLFLAVAIFATFSFSKNSVSNAEIAEMVNKNLLLNKGESKDLIYPGNFLYWTFPDGFTLLTQIKEGENRWRIAKNLLVNYEPAPLIMAPSINRNIENKQTQQGNFIKPVNIKQLWDKISIGEIIIITLIIIIFMYWLYFATKKEEGQIEKERKEKEEKENKKEEIK